MFKVWIKLHELLITESSPSLHEVSRLTYCQEEHQGSLARLSLGEMLWLSIATLNEVRLFFWEL